MSGRSSDADERTFIFDPSVQFTATADPMTCASIHYRPRSGDAARNVAAAVGVHARAQRRRTSAKAETDTGHYGHRGFSRLGKLVGNTCVVDTFLAHFP